MATAIAERRHGFGFILPLLVVMVAAFNLPILYMLMLGFWSKAGGFTAEHYERVLDTPIYLRVLGNTLRVSVVATLVNVAIGYPLAYWMRGLSPRAQFIAMICISSSLSMPWIDIMVVR